MSGKEQGLTKRDLFRRAGAAAIVATVPTATAVASTATDVGLGLSVSSISEALAAALNIAATAKVRQFITYAAHQGFLFNDEFGLLGRNAPLATFQGQSFPNFNDETYAQIALEQFADAEQLMDALQSMENSDLPLTSFTIDSLNILQTNTPHLLQKHETETLLANIERLQQEGCENWKDARIFIAKRCVPVMENLFKLPDVFSSSQVKRLGRIATQCSSDEQTRALLSKQLEKFREANAIRSNNQARSIRQNAACATTDRKPRQKPLAYSIISQPRRNSRASWFLIVPPPQHPPVTRSMLNALLREKGGHLRYGSFCLHQKANNAVLVETTNPVLINALRGPFLSLRPRPALPLATLTPPSA